MARNHHTFAKRQREIEKKRKADEKRAKRRARTQHDATTAAPEQVQTAVDECTEPSPVDQTSELLR